MNRFDTPSRLAFSFASDEASILHQVRLSPGHLLLGLMHSDGGARDVLEQLGARLGSLRTLYRHLSPLTDRVLPAQQASFSPQIRRVIGGACREAHELGMGITMSQHILLALMRENDPVLRQMLKSIDPDLGQIRGPSQAMGMDMEQVA